MSRRKAKRKSENIIKYEGNNLSQEQMIEIQAEAYYKALKRIEEEKCKSDEQNQEKRQYKWYEETLFFLNACLWPWKISKSFSVSSRIYDSIPVLFVSGVLRVAGGCMWLVGLVGVASGLYSLVIRKGLGDVIVIGVISLILLLLGSIFILAGGEFEKETDSNKIYAYSASIIALLSCIVSIVALMGI